MLGGLVLAATLAVTGAGPVLAQPASAAASSAHTFYTPPSDLASLAPGAVIRSRTVGVPAYGIPLPVQAWQLVYRSNNTEGTAIAATTTVIIPPGKPAGPRPLISYQAIINALDPECSPSRTLPSGGLEEIFMLLWPLLRGWAVSVPDHAGPDSNYGADASAVRSLSTASGLRNTSLPPSSGRTRRSVCGGTPVVDSPPRGPRSCSRAMRPSSTSWAVPRAGCLPTSMT